MNFKEIGEACTYTALWADYQAFCKLDILEDESQEQVCLEIISDKPEQRVHFVNNFAKYPGSLDIAIRGDMKNLKRLEDFGIN